ncbi:MAG: hypothetical protein D6750_10305 [Bacteroidetes bacterium]|nr:MAG: hypothetical protein D6750_10305 [Bacteroidota bacterium]
MRNLSRNESNLTDTLESLRALAIELGDRNDEARYQLGLLLAVARQNSGALYQDLVHVLRERYEKRTLDNYALVASAFPREMFEELRARNPNLGFSAFIESAKLAEPLRIPFLTICSAHWLKVQAQRRLAANIRKMCRTQGLSQTLKALTDQDGNHENNTPLLASSSSTNPKMILKPEDCQIVQSYLIIKLDPEQIKTLQQMTINRIEIS